MIRDSDQTGFALVELLVAMSLVSVVVMATVSAFASFNKTERVNRLHNESTDEARLAVERIASQLRNLASPNDLVPESVEKAEPYDLVFLTVDAIKPVGSLNARNIKRVRYCVTPVTAGKAKLIRMEQTWQIEDPPPAFSTASCSDVNAGGWEVTAVAANDLTNTANATPTPVFTYTPGPTPLEDVTAIRADVTVDTNPGESPAAVSLGSAVFLRNQNRKPMAECTAVPTGTGRQIALNGSASEDPEGFNLKRYSWYANGDEDTVVADGVVGVWDAQTAGAHTIVLEVEDHGGLTARATCGASVP
jgi:prepilin-type N-terminal cleavage/methylation domain-containing protein